MKTPAETVIHICGGVSETARLSGRSTISVRRWTYPEERGGTGGLVPSKAQKVLLEAARSEGVPLQPEHFHEPSPEPAS